LLPRPARPEPPALAAPANSRRAGEDVAAGKADYGFAGYIEEPNKSKRPPLRFVAPPPALTPENASKLLTQQSATGSRQEENCPHAPGAIAAGDHFNGRFEKSEPTLHHGQDFGCATYSGAAWR